MSSFGTEQESYFEQIEKILVDSWKTKMRSCENLRQFVDLKKLTELDVPTFNDILKKMTETDSALLKELRKYEKDRIARGASRLKYQITLLESQKSSLINERSALLAEINYYKL